METELNSKTSPLKKKPTYTRRKIKDSTLIMLNELLANNQVNADRTLVLGYQ